MPRGDRTGPDGTYRNCLPQDGNYSIERPIRRFFRRLGGLETRIEGQEGQGIGRGGTPRAGGLGLQRGYRRGNRYRTR